MEQVTVAVGASEALYALMQSLVNPGDVCRVKSGLQYGLMHVRMFCGDVTPGDEVVMLGPAFDMYSAQTILAGALRLVFPKQC